MRPEVRSGRATIECRDLLRFTRNEVSIDVATLVPGGDELPEACVVRGQILPEIRFEVSLPTEWNGRLFMFGNGGFGGEALDAAPRVQRRNRALRSGFAVAQTNMGHDSRKEPLFTFA